MAVKPWRFMFAIFLAISISSCATSDQSDDFVFDYSSAEVGDFNGTWKGRLNCGKAIGFKPYATVEISDGRGQFGFGGELNFGLGSLHADLDLQNGKINWAGQLKPSFDAKEKSSVSFNGQWRRDNFNLKGRLGSSSCKGVLAKL